MEFIYLCTMVERKGSDWLPVTQREVEARGWEYLDVIIFTGDAYVDHPSFGAAVIGRTLETLGLRVALVPQPNWQDDGRDFKKLGRPRLFFAVSAGAMDSMVNKYTANKRLRSEDAYTPDGRIDRRPEYPTIVYTSLLKKKFPDVPVVIGGIEASMRRLSHYDYWQDKLLPSILIPSQADFLVYGCGEKPLAAIVAAMQKQPFSDFSSIPQTVFLQKEYREMPGDTVLHPYELCLKDKRRQAENFRHIEEESNRMTANRLIQKTGDQWVIVNPAYPPMTTKEIDACYDLPYTRLPHPKYKDKRIPAYEMIRHSITIHRGCFGGCAFCTISAHQGKFIASRSKESILKEVKAVTTMPDFKGIISDLGGPSANMYRMNGIDRKRCEACKKPSCIFPKICQNLHADHRPLLDLYLAVDAIPGIKKSFIGSGVRYDLLVHRYENGEWNRSAHDYTQELIRNHVSGRLKVAPEHTSPATLECIRKPGFPVFLQFKKIFDKLNRKENLNRQLIPYFISSLPACTEKDMADLAAIIKNMNYYPEQVQDFTPTPMTLATEIYYAGVHPYTLQPVNTAKSQKEKLNQRKYFFWYKKES
jgi:uncharacterized radical SAM protein YgiQ